MFSPHPAQRLFDRFQDDDTEERVLTVNSLDASILSLPWELLHDPSNGGVFLFDEIDAADANVLLVVNSALANGRMSVPSRHDQPVAKKHSEFVCIAAANTFGRGADRVYVGRNELDEATLDRFRIGNAPRFQRPRLRKRLR